LAETLAATARPSQATRTVVPGGGATLAGDAIVFVSSVLLAERTVYLARAVHHLDPVKLLLAQAVIGSGAFSIYSAIAEPQPTHWPPHSSPSSPSGASSSPASTS